MPTLPLPHSSSACPPAGGAGLCLLHVAETLAMGTGGGRGWFREAGGPFDPFRIKEGVVRQRQGDDKDC